MFPIDLPLDFFEALYYANACVLIFAFLDQLLPQLLQ